MTTIVYHNNEIAYDSRVTRGNIIHDDNYNKRLTEKGVEFFISGSTSASRAMADAYHRGRFAEVDDEEKTITEALIWHKKKLFLGYFDGDKICIDEERLNNTVAIGSGGDLARMAIQETGCSAAEAVAAAMRMDTATGGRIRTFSLKT